ncbi:MAG: hypothetical protein BWY26_00793 [Elusimicrobia bacterium ADurb.Bin231]|nr:MAG: hypothetical protein BWY26_00793 [Elusimicrobia bacterium ADurb.Bin231]
MPHFFNPLDKIDNLNYNYNGMKRNFKNFIASENAQSSTEYAVMIFAILLLQWGMNLFVIRLGKMMATATEKMAGITFAKD